MNAIVNRTTPRDVEISGKQFHIFPFGALKSANLSGELAQIAVPLIAAVSAIPTGDGDSPLDADLEKIAPALSGAFNSLSGDKLEKLLKKLLIDGKNVSIDLEDGSAVYLTEDLLDEAFVCDIVGIYMLAFEVIKTNYGGFFEKLGNLSGSVTEKVKILTKAATASPNTESST